MILVTVSDPSILVSTGYKAMGSAGRPSPNTTAKLMPNTKVYSSSQI